MNKGSSIERSEQKLGEGLAPRPEPAADERITWPRASVIIIALIGIFLVVLAYLSPHG